jgi:hypothetical protein
MTDRQQLEQTLARLVRLHAEATSLQEQLVRTYALMYGRPPRTRLELLQGGGRTTRRRRGRLKAV